MIDPPVNAFRLFHVEHPRQQRRKPDLRIRRPKFDDVPHLGFEPTTAHRRPPSLMSIKCPGTCSTLVNTSSPSSPASRRTFLTIHTGKSASTRTVSRLCTPSSRMRSNLSFTFRNNSISRSRRPMRRAKSAMRLPRPLSVVSNSSDLSGAKRPAILRKVLASPILNPN